MSRRSARSRRSRGWVAAATLATLLGWGAACTPEEGTPGADADTLTRRERDSILGESALPGARGVRGALRAADSAAARARRADSIGGVP